MVNESVPNESLIGYLVREGLVPEECTLINVVFVVDSVVRIDYSVHLTDTRLEAFRRAFAAYLGDRASAESARQLRQQSMVPPVSDGLYRSGNADGEG